MITNGASGLLAFQSALTTISHNISNASTPGYTRQSVALAAKAFVSLFPLLVVAAALAPEVVGDAIKGTLLARFGLSGPAQDLVLAAFGGREAVRSSSGVLGIVLGVTVSLALSRFAGWGALVTVRSVIIAFGFSAGVGVVFGLWPARKAALLSPIEALRYE